VNSISLTRAGIVLSWANQSGQNYDVLYKTNLTDSSWADFKLSISGSAATLSWTDMVSSLVGQRFYEVVH
jgi:hypothetical protein